MFNVVLFEPEIPPNTGNIIRLCSNTGCHLHLIEPLGFNLEEKSLRRAGLDYHEYSSVQTYANWQTFVTENKPLSFYALTTKGTQTYSEAVFKEGDFLVFGPETRGLPEDVLKSQSPDSNMLTIPMQKQSRSLNLSNSVAIVVYEAWRQVNFHTD